MFRSNKVKFETVLQNNCANTTKYTEANSETCSWPPVNELQTMNGKHEYSSTFLHLEQMTKMLTNETEELQQKFQNQASYIKERDEKILRNKENLTKIDANIDELKSEQLKVELELQENDAYLEEAEQLLGSLETDTAKYEQATAVNVGQCEYAKLIKLLESNDISQIHFEELKYIMQDFNKLAALYTKQPEAFRNVINIMNYYTNEMQTKEKQIHVLQDKIEKITNEYNEIKFASNENQTI